VQKILGTNFNTLKIIFLLNDQFDVLVCNKNSTYIIILKHNFEISNVKFLINNQTMKEKFKILFLLLFLMSQAYGQSRKISGTVTDDQGQTLPGATVVLVGTTLGFITDMDGKYTLNAAPGDQLKFSFIGYQDQTRTVGKELVMNVQMLTDSKMVEEVVIVGYGIQKKATVVGAITQTTSEELKMQGNVVNLTQALTGSMPGITILNTSGIPGGSSNDGYSKPAEILIRGKNTWNNASPLILVDGIERSMNDVDINEVESVSVLKDASATAVFGMKGGNGVILITTKRGVAGKPKLTFEANKTFETISKYPLVIDTYSAMIARNYAVINEVDLIPTSWNFFTNDQILNHYKNQDLPFAFPDNDWHEIILKDFASSHRFNMNVSGGTKFVNYFGSLSYVHEGDIMNTQDLGRGYNPEFSYDRFNARTNYDFTFSKSTKLKASISGMYGRQQQSSTSVHSLYTSIYNHAPNFPVIQYEDGVYGFTKDEYLNNQNEFKNLNTSGTNLTNRLEILSDFALEQKLDFVTKGLSFRGKLAYDNFFQTSGPNISDGGVNTKWINPDFYLAGGKYNYETKQYELNGVAVDMVNDGWAEYQNYFSGTTGFGWVPSELGYSTEGFSKSDINGSRYTLYYEASLNYIRDFGKHGVSALALFSRQKSETGDRWPGKREDWVGRVTYDYNSRYFAEVNGAYNGSEAFGPGYKFDFFPSVAVGWNIANELFMKENAPFIQILKIKYSNGLVGNDRVDAGNWPYLTIWGKGNPVADDNGSDKGFGVTQTPSYQKYQEGTPGNPDLRWEKANKQNLGAEISLFKGLISGSVDLFKEHRYDMLVAADQRTVPHIFGQTPPAANIGEVKSKGMEIEGSISKSYNNGFNFKVGGSWTFSKNEVILREDAELKPFYQKDAGYPIGQMRVTQETGLIKSWDDAYNGVISVGSNINRLPGDFIFMDYNANGKIDPNDSAPYGYPVYPLSTYTANFNVGYKGWNLSALFYGIHNVTRNVGFDVFLFNQATIHQQYIDATATPEFGNPNPTYPQLNLTRITDGNGTFNYFDGALLRLKSIELSYTLPKKWVKSIGVSNVRFYANGNNLFVWTQMPMDGEGRNRADDTYRNYPLKRTATIGANIQF